MKRKIAICHLLLNDKLSIHKITKTPDETYRRAVNILMEQGIIQEQRSLCRDEYQQKLSLSSIEEAGVKCLDVVEFRQLPS